MTAVTSRPPCAGFHVRFVERVLAKAGVRGEDGRDIRQEVLLAAHRAMGSFRHEASLETWLYRICIREVSRHLRKHQRAEPTAFIAEASSVAAPQLREILEREGGTRLGSALARLGETKRAALELHAVEELSMKEIAKVLGCPVQTAYSRVRAAKLELAVLLAGPGPDSSPDERLP